MAGALGDPPDGALLVFRARLGGMQVEDFARADPYVRGGARHRVARAAVDVVIGADAAPPRAL